MADTFASGPRLLRVDPATLRVRGQPSAEPIDVHVASGTEGVWFTSAARAPGSGSGLALEARRIDPSSGRVVARTRLARFRAGRLVVGGLTVSAGAVWVSANRFRWRGATPHATGTVWRLDPSSGRVTARTRVPAGAAALLAADGAVWIAGAGMPVISRLDARTAALTGKVHVGPQPFALASANDAVWVTDSQDGTVRRIDPPTQRVTATIHVGRAPYGIAADARGLWVAVLGDSALARIDPVAERVAQRIHTGGDPVAVAADGHHVWVALNSDRALLRLTP